MNYIEITGLHKHYGSVHAVNGLDMEVRRGDVCGFLGPNGAGKSTTIRMLLTLIRPTAGSIRVFGKELRSARKEILSKTGALIEKPDFYLNLTAWQNLELLRRFSGVSLTRKEVLAVLELVGLDHRHDSKVKTFSQGMKQRLGLAQALLHDPDLIVLDEPGNGLDPQGIKDMRDLILLLSRGRGKTILISSHQLHEVEMVADHMLIINRGSAVAAGSVDELLGKGDLQVTVETGDRDRALQALNGSRFAACIEPPPAPASPNAPSPKLTLRLRSEEVAELNKLLVESGIRVDALVPVRSLEAYFLKITAQAT